MKAAPFAYARPATIDDAVEELTRSGGEAKVLAGGQSLVPVLAMRLARPPTLVDISAIRGLDVVHRTGERVEVGAAVQQRRLELSHIVATVPLLAKALPWVGHRELRSRGTVCGSLAHADPAAELPAVACCLGAELEAAGPHGRRAIAVADFFTGAMSTALAEDELLTAVRFPTAATGEGFGFAEIARRHGDFALAGVATRVQATTSRPDTAVLTAFGVSDRPVTRDLHEPLKDAIDEVGADAGLERLTDALAEPLSDVAEKLVGTAGDAHGSPGYRKRLLRVLAARELARAYHHAVAPPSSEEVS